MELYVHIPYCRQKCRYCDFASYPAAESTMPAYVEALLQEASAVAPLAEGKPLSTAFIGGGTPSILPARLMEKLLCGLRRHFAFPAGMEFTAEANPGTLTEDWLQAVRDGGVNRLSMGMQAAQPGLLKALGRIHAQADVEASVGLARRMGFDNLSLDLMFGLPGQTREMWRETLHAAIALEPHHLSCYGLIPEEGTPLVRDLDAGRLVLPDADEERAMYDDALDFLSQHGFQQYEISNFALPGHECQHNVGYWRQVPYLGLGASAASMVTEGQEEKHWTNPAAIREYTSMVQTGNWPLREETRVSAADARFETLMLGLRMTEGVSVEGFHRRHGVALDAYCGPTLRSLAEQGLVEIAGGFLRLTRRGMDVQNAILVEILEAVEGAQ